ncbi:hypothetical protein E2C01_039290 [Portunus trituberculatus]|uniref:Uncharacterized protein n=1 Tax=Portunus trituberculatus TaxID=210409 RepID=A0A5B7FJH0_PORTR|nr:hypothetical protein [Portunus trituberculatus]
MGYLSAHWAKPPSRQDETQSLNSDSQILPFFCAHNGYQPSTLSSNRLYSNKKKKR